MADSLDFNQVEAALAAVTSGPYAAFTTLITLPNKTWELRTCSAIKIANGVDAGRPGVFFLGGIHADEWGCPDILVNFIQKLGAAYVDTTRQGLRLGGKSFSYDDIRTIFISEVRAWADEYQCPTFNGEAKTAARLRAFLRAKLA